MERSHPVRHILADEIDNTNLTGCGIALTNCSLIISRHDTEITCRALITVRQILTCSREYYSRFWFPLASWLIVFLVVLVVHCYAQESPQPTPTEAPSTVGARSSSDPATKPGSQINVNWFYGSYVPKDVPLEPLSRDQRLQLYIRQTYTTWGIYIKTMLFTVHDQIRDTNPQWGDSWEGFGKRLGTRQVQFIVQNSTTSLGDGLLGWEPRYDRCRCNGFWPRTGHAVARNFVTYAGDEKSLRPQLMPYVGAFAGGAAVATWQPGKTRIYIAGYQGAITQVFVGAGINWIGEFAPEISRKLHRKK